MRWGLGRGGEELRRAYKRSRQHSNTGESPDSSGATHQALKTALIEREKGLFRCGEQELSPITKEGVT